MVKTEAFDAARYLTSPEAQAELLNDALGAATPLMLLGRLAFSRVRAE